MLPTARENSAIELAPRRHLSASRSAKAISVGSGSGEHAVETGNPVPRASRVSAGQGLSSDERSSRIATPPWSAGASGSRRACRPRLVHRTDRDPGHDRPTASQPGLERPRAPAAERGGGTEPGAASRPASDDRAGSTMRPSRATMGKRLLRLPRSPASMRRRAGACRARSAKATTRGWVRRHRSPAHPPGRGTSHRGFHGRRPPLQPGRPDRIRAVARADTIRSPFDAHARTPGADLTGRAATIRPRGCSARR